MLSFIVDLGVWNWIIAGVLLFILEVFLPGVFLLWFGFAAAVVGVLALATGMGFSAQIAVFALAAIASVLMARKLFHYGAVGSDRPNLNLRGQQYIGRTLVVAESITNGRGRVKVGDSLWSAEGPDAEAGARVRVTGARSTVLIVEAVPASENLPKAGSFS